MKTKLEMSHEYAIALINSDCEMQFDKFIRLCWNYADAMQAEADKREKEKQEKLKQDQQNHHAELVSIGLEEWQPDWSQAPDDATAWEYLGHNSARWHTTTKGMYKSAELFGFSGIDMLILKRPN